MQWNVNAVEYLIVRDDIIAGVRRLPDNEVDPMPFMTMESSIGTL